jgi:hypothetical protein
MTDVFFGLLVVCIVAAIREYGEFSLGKVSVESHTLFNFKEIASVRVQNERRTSHHRQYRPQIEEVFTVSSSIIAELIEEWFGSLPVPASELRLQIGIKFLKSLGEF